MSNGPLRPGPMSFQDWRRRFSTIVQGAKEIVSWMYRHRQAYTSASTTSLTFFQATVSGVNGNWPGPNGLNNGVSFLAQAIGVTIQLDPSEAAAAAATDSQLPGAIADMSNLIYDSFGKLKIGGKDYGEWPLYKLQAGGGPVAALSTAATTTAGQNIVVQHATNGPADIRAVYSLPIPLAIPPLFSVDFTAEWPTAVTMFSGENPNIEVWMDGQLMRPVQ